MNIYFGIFVICVLASTDLYPMEQGNERSLARQNQTEALDTLYNEVLNVRNAALRNQNDLRFLSKDHSHVKSSEEPDEEPNNEKSDDLSERDDSVWDSYCPIIHQQAKALGMLVLAADLTGIDQLQKSLKLDLADIEITKILSSDDENGTLNEQVDQYTRVDKKQWLKEKFTDTIENWINEIVCPIRANREALEDVLKDCPDELKKKEFNTLKSEEIESFFLNKESTNNNNIFAVKMIDYFLKSVCFFLKNRKKRSNCNELISMEEILQEVILYPIDIQRNLCLFPYEVANYNLKREASLIAVKAGKYSGGLLGSGAVGLGSIMFFSYMLYSRKNLTPGRFSFLSLFSLTMTATAIVGAYCMRQKLKKLNTECERYAYRFEYLLLLIGRLEKAIKDLDKVASESTEEGK